MKSGMQMSSGTILLDTHVWIAIVLGEKFAKNIIEQIISAKDSGTLFVTAISVWEVAMLEAKKKLSFTLPITEWIEKALDHQGLNLIELSPKIAIESANLPGNFHGDPADRIIVASARVNNLMLLTKDTKIINYSDLGYVKTLRY